MSLFSENVFKPGPLRGLLHSHQLTISSLAPEPLHAEHHLLLRFRFPSPLQSGSRQATLLPPPMRDVGRPAGNLRIFEICGTVSFGAGAPPPQKDCIDDDLPPPKDLIDKAIDPPGQKDYIDDDLR